MAKHAVYEPLDNSNVAADQQIKQAALLFDKVFVKKGHIAPSSKNFIKYRSSKELTDLFRENHASYDFLVAQGVIVPFEIPHNFDIESLTRAEMQLFRHSISCNFKGANLFVKMEQAKDQRERTNGLENFCDMMDRGTDALTRYCAIRLAKTNLQEFYPILRSTKSFGRRGSKTEAVRLLLNHIPQPTADTPWEAIVDFRQDESTRLKYLALMNWINELTSSSLTVNELNEKLEYLYLDYKRSVERHRLKATTGILEIITGAAIGFFTSNVPAALNLASNIVKVGTTVLHLHEEEGRLPGKEIAYIYHANKRFRNDGFPHCT
jgi:hypothetical protein